jgi:hypothetical protein
MKDCRGKGDIRSSIVLYASTSLTVDLTFFEICELKFQSHPDRKEKAKDFGRGL